MTPCCLIKSRAAPSPSSELDRSTCDLASLCLKTSRPQDLKTSPPSTAFPAPTAHSLELLDTLLEQALLHRQSGLAQQQARARRVIRADCRLPSGVAVEHEKHVVVDHQWQGSGCRGCIRLRAC